MKQLTLPQLHPMMRMATITKVHPSPGAALAPGTALFDLSLDLSAAIMHDCPPISYYRLVLHEMGTLVSITVAPGDKLMCGAVLAEFDPTPHVGPADRQVRVAVAEIVADHNWWDELGE